MRNIDQIAVAIALYQTTVVAIYLPILTISGILTGLFTGFFAQLLVNRLKGKLYQEKTPGGTEKALCSARHFLLFAYDSSASQKRMNMSACCSLACPDFWVVI